MTKYFRRFGLPNQVPAIDTTPPTTPTGLSATAANPSVLSLSGPSTDNVAVTGYQIWRKTGAGGTYAQIGTTNSWPWTDSTVLNSTTYFWKVLAYDAAGNLSNFCTPATASIPGGLAADTTAPNTPSAPTLVANGTTNITIAVQLTTDSTANSGTQVVSGMGSYEVAVNGSVVGAPVAQPSSTLTFAAGVDIGSPSPAGTDANASGTYTLTCGGNQLGGTSDQIHFLAGSVSSDFDFTARVVSVTSSSGNAYAKAALMARDGPDPAAQDFYVAAFSGTTGMDAEWRSPAGTAAGWNGALLAHVPPYYAKISRRGNTFTGYTSPDGITWTLQLTKTIAMGNSISLGLACSESNAADGVTTAQLTAVFDTVTFTAATAADFTDAFIGSSSPVPRLYTVAGVDNAGNVGAFSASLSVTPIAQSAGAIKWNPGFYAQTANYAQLGNNLASAKATEIAQVRAGPAAVKGLQFIYYPPLFENTAAGVYDFSQVDADYVGITGWNGSTYSSPRRYMFQLSTEYYFSISPSVCIPAYILNNPATYGAAPSGYSTGGWWTHPGSGVVWSLWHAANANRLIAMMQALASHVLPDGYTLDSSPYCEAIWPIFETAASPTADDGSYSASAWSTSCQNIISACRSAFPHTNIGLVANYLGANSDMHALQAALQALGASACDEDTTGSSGYPGNATQGQVSYLGGYGGLPSLVGSVPFMSGVALSELIYASVGGGNFTPADIFAQQQRLNATHGIWQIGQPGISSVTAGLWFGSANGYTQWATNPAGYGGVLYQLANSTLSNTAYPSNFP